MTDGYKIKRVLTWVNGVEKQIYPARRLPSAYQEVEYIETDGNAYIDTGFKPNNNTRYLVEYYKTNVVSSPIGCYNNPANYGLIINDTGLHYCTSYANITGLSVNTRLKADFNKNQFYLNNALKQTFTATTFNMNINAWMFCWNRNGVQSNNAAGIKIYSCKIYDNGILTRDFVPCYRKQDNVIGMYDLVNNTFYTNSGSGTFTKGPNV